MRRSVAAAEFPHRQDRSNPRARQSYSAIPQKQKKRYAKEATAVMTSDFRAGVRPSTIRENREIVCRECGRPVLNAAIAFEHFHAERRQYRAAAPYPSRRGCGDRLGKS